jgi:hypothetical protein
MANEFKHKDPGGELTQAEFIAACGDGHVFASQATGDLLYADSATVLNRLARAGSGSQMLQIASCKPAWTATPSLGTTSWCNMNHAHGAGNSGGTVCANVLAGTTLKSTVVTSSLETVGTLSALTVDDVAINGKVVTMTGSACDTIVMTAAANGAFSLVTTDTAGANGNIVITADGTVEIDSAGNLTLDSAADIEFNADGGCVNFKDGSLALAAIVNTSCVGELRLHEACHYVGFKAPALSASQIWTLPAADGNACDVLTCNGSGVLSWAAAASGPCQASVCEIRGGTGAGDFSAGSNVDKYIPPDLLMKHYGVAKAWVHVAAAGTEAAPSYNICAVCDTGTGNRLVTFVIDFDNQAYNIHGLSDSNAGSIYAERTSVSSGRFYTLDNAATPNLQDRYSGMLYFGNQA